MITKIKSSKTAALKFSMGVLVTAGLLLIFAFDNVGNKIQSQETTGRKTEIVVNDQQKSTRTFEPVFEKADQMPVFPGGESALIKFFSDEIKYPDDAKKAGIQGKVFVYFVINKEGNIVNAKIARGVSPSIDEEALRVVKKMPKWTSGKNKGKNVLVKYTLPIAFALK